jgi:hypothetical protein
MQLTAPAHTMQDTLTAGRVLVLGWGNPSRGDDALGPELVRRLEALAASRAGWREHEFLTAFQLHPEHALDLAGRDLVLFADASTRAPAPFSLTRLAPTQDRPPPAYLLAIRGETFALGEPMSTAAEHHLEAAVALAVGVLDKPHAVPSLPGRGSTNHRIS